jgi:hypothetical protein
VSQGANSALAVCADEHAKQLRLRKCVMHNTSRVVHERGQFWRRGCSRTCCPMGLLSPPAILLLCGAVRVIKRIDW